MRKKLFVLLIIFAITLTGCRATPPHTNSDTASDNVSEDTIRDVESETSTSNSYSDSSIWISGNEDASVPVLSPESEETNLQVPKQPDNSSSKEDEKTATVKEPVNPQPEKPNPGNPNPAPAEPIATASDAKAIADKVVEYINQYRREQNISSAKYLPGLTQYAEYRSRQLISNFAHDTDDERAAATALKYGEYIDPALYGMTGDPYYTACAGEAIAKAGYTGTVEEVAKSLAALVRNSSAHWCYVGAAKYHYIGVGITYESGMWYCDIALTIENHG